MGREGEKIPPPPQLGVLLDQANQSVHSPESPVPVGAPAAYAVPSTGIVPALETDSAAHAATSVPAAPVVGPVTVPVAAPASPPEESFEGGVENGVGVGGGAKVIYPTDGVEVEINGEDVRANFLGVAGYFYFQSFHLPSSNRNPYYVLDIFDVDMPPPLLPPLPSS